MKISHRLNTAKTAGKELPWFEKLASSDSAIKTGINILLLIFFGFLIYANTYQNPFTFDDINRISENQDIRLQELTLSNILKAASGKNSAKSRPVGNISFALNYYFHQYNLFGYHLVNNIIHVLNGILLYLFLITTLTLKQVRPKIKHAEWIALFTALLWLVNPIQTQSVTYIVQRLNSMAALFFLISFLFYVRGRLATKSWTRWSWFIGAALSWFLALGTKQNTASLPFFIFLYEWYFFQSLSADWLKRNLRYFLIIVAIFILVSFIYLGSSPLDRLASINDYSKKAFTISERLMTQWRVVIYYLGLILLPHPSRLNLDYDFPLSYSLFNPFTTLLSLVGIIGLILLAVFLARKQRLISFSIFWFLGNLVIESSVIPLAIIFEHRAYLPSMLISLVPVLLLFKHIKHRLPVVGVICALILLYSYWTIERNKVWRDNLTLWTDCVEKSPKKARPHSLLGVAQKKLDMTAEAFLNFRKATELDPNFVDAHHNIGVMLEEQNEIKEAIKHYRKTLELDPGYVESRNNLGVALLKQNKSEEAIEHFLITRQIDPNFTSAHYNLGVARAKQGRLNEAIESYEAALKINPKDSNTHVKIGDVLLMLGKPDQAVTYFQTALQLDPENADAYLFLGSQMLNQGQKEEALDYLNKALRINPKLAQAHLNIGIIMIRQGNLETAISHFRQAAEIDPNFKLAQINLKKALAIQKRMSQKDAPIQKVPNKNQNNPISHYEMGNRYLSKGKLPKAIAEFEAALALKPDFFAANNNLALAYAANRQYEEALAAFKKLIELDPANTGAYYNIAVLYALQNKVPEAIDWLKQAVDKGYQNWRLIKNDRDLANIRDSEEYKKLVEGH